jgi:hypothetical protein
MVDEHTLCAHALGDPCTRRARSCSRPNRAVALKVIGSRTFESDPSDVSLEQKVINDKPAGTADLCLASSGRTDVEIVDVGFLSDACAGQIPELQGVPTTLPRAGRPTAGTGARGPPLRDNRLMLWLSTIMESGPGVTT